MQNVSFSLAITDLFLLRMSNGNATETKKQTGAPILPQLSSTTSQKKRGFCKGVKWRELKNDAVAQEIRARSKKPLSLKQPAELEMDRWVNSENYQDFVAQYFARWDDERSS
jgi:hypothetical protein